MNQSQAQLFTTFAVLCSMIGLCYAIRYDINRAFYSNVRKAIEPVLQKMATEDTKGLLDLLDQGDTKNQQTKSIAVVSAILAAMFFFLAALAI